MQFFNFFSVFLFFKLGTAMSFLLLKLANIYVYIYSSLVLVKLGMSCLTLRYISRVHLYIRGLKYTSIISGICRQIKQVREIVATKLIGSRNYAIIQGTYTNFTNWSGAYMHAPYVQLIQFLCLRQNQLMKESQTFTIMGQLNEMLSNKNIRTLPLLICSLRLG